MENFEIIDRYGTKVYGNKWEIKKANANVVIVHGMAEHSARYDDFASYLNNNGFNVYALDHKGHKLNTKEELGEDELGVWDKKSFGICVDRVKDEIDIVNNNGLPTYVFSHSMGSFMGQMLIEKYPGIVTKIVLCGSSGKQGLYKLGKILSHIHCFGKKLSKKSFFLNKVAFASYNNKIKKTNTKFDWLSVNEENVNVYMQDPYCGFVPSRGFFLSFMDGLVNISKKKNLKKIDTNTKILLVAGEEDPVGGYGKYVRVLQRQYIARKISSSMILYKSLRHEILNEKENAKIYEDILSFLKG